MMASPLPKTKAPAAAKKVNSAHRVPPAVAPTASRAARGSGEKLATPVFPFLQAFQNDLGGALTSQTRRPAAGKGSPGSACGRMVRIAVTRKIAKRSEYHQFVLFVTC